MKKALSYSLHLLSEPSELEAKRSAIIIKEGQELQ